MVGFAARGALRPTAPVISAAPVGSNAAKITLLTPSEEPQTGISSYTLLRRPSLGGGPFLPVQMGILPSAFPYTDTPLLPSTAYDYALQGIDKSAQLDASPSSNIASITTGSATNSIVFIPGIRVAIGNTFGFSSLTDITTNIAIIAGQNLNGVVVGMDVASTWSTWENPNQQGDYTGGWDTTGQSGATLLITLYDLAKAQGWDLSIQVNSSGNGQAGFPHYPTSFAPNYLNNVLYGPIDGNGNAGGVYFTATAGPVVRYWNANVAQRMCAIPAGLMAECARRGRSDVHIYRWDPIMEMGNTGVPGYTDAAILGTIGILASGLRAALPTSRVMFRSTFPVQKSNFQQFFINMGQLANRISVGNYDNVYESGTFARRIWGDCVQRGGFPDGANDAFGHPSFVAQPGWPQYVGDPTTGALDYDFECYTNANELGSSRGNNLAVPPAGLGSGFLPDANGHMTQQRCRNGYLQNNTFEGPNSNRTKFSSAAPANPNPPNGPGGGVAQHPLLIEQFGTWNGGYPNGSKWLPVTSTRPANL